MKIKKNDLVQTIFGGPTMIVKEIIDKECKCMWFDANNSYQSELFDLKILEKKEGILRNDPYPYRYAVASIGRDGIYGYGMFNSMHAVP